MLRLTAFACLAATAASFTAFKPLSPALSRPAGGSHHKPLSSGERPANPLVLHGTGWVALRDQASGQVYYSNSNTGATQWDPPMREPGTALWNFDCVAGVAGFSGVEGFMCTRDGMITRFTLSGPANKVDDGAGVDTNEANHRLEHGRDGRPCQLPYQIGIGDEKVLGRFNMINPSPSVSRGQCNIRCTADGAAILASDGDSPTLIRSGGGQWEYIYKDQQRFLQEGDQISLDANNPEGAVFVCNRDAGGQAAAGWNPSNAAAWVAQVDQASGQTYYMNQQTGESRWDPPN